MVAVILDDHQFVDVVDLRGGFRSVRLTHATRIMRGIDDVQWRGESILLSAQRRATVFRVDTPERPTLDQDQLALSPGASLSADGRWLLVADVYVVRCLSTEDGSERWWQQIMHRDSEVALAEARWSPDGASIVLRYPRSLVRLETTVGGTLGFWALPSAAASAISPGAREVASCLATLRGRPDVLQLTTLRRLVIPAPRVGTREVRRYRRYQRDIPVLQFTRVPLPDGACVMASVEWLDDRTVGVRGTSLHLVRDGEEVLSLRVAQIAGEIWVERNGRDLARLRHDQAAMFPMLP